MEHGVGRRQAPPAADAQVKLPMSRRARLPGCSQRGSTPALLAARRGHARARRAAGGGGRAGGREGRRHASRSGGTRIGRALSAQPCVARATSRDSRRACRRPWAAACRRGAAALACTRRRPSSGGLRAGCSAGRRHACACDCRFHGRSTERGTSSSRRAWSLGTRARAQPHDPAAVRPHGGGAARGGPPTPPRA
jgi:hypothetical protein